MHRGLDYSLLLSSQKTSRRQQNACPPLLSPTRLHGLIDVPVLIGFDPATPVSPPSGSQARAQRGVHPAADVIERAVVNKEHKRTTARAHFLNPSYGILRPSTRTSPGRAQTVPVFSHGKRKQRVDASGLIRPVQLRLHDKDRAGLSDRGPCQIPYAAMGLIMMASKISSSAGRPPKHDVGSHLRAGIADQQGRSPTPSWCGRWRLRVRILSSFVQRFDRIAMQKPNQLR